jgi:hypothetical protein
VAGIHVLLTNLQQKERIDITVRSDSFDVGVEIYQLIDVPVEINTGIESRTEKWDGKHNPYVIRRAPFKIYEALQPIQSPFFCEKETVALRLQWKIPAYAIPDHYQLNIKIKGMSFEKRVKLNLVVHEVVLPAQSNSIYGYTNWFSVHQISQCHNLEVWSDQFWTMLKKYADLMAYGRQNTFIVPLSEMFNIEENEPQLNKQRIERFIRLFKSAGLPYIEFSHFAFRTNNDWELNTMSSALRRDLLVNSKEGQEFHRSIFKQLRQIIEINGWQNACRFHVADEPTDILTKDYKRFVNLFREYFPKAKIMEATMTEQLEGVVDIWTPQLQEYQHNRKFFDGLKEDGALLWIYSCLIPGGKWLNRLIDQERLRMVYIGWSLSYFDLDGFLHWGLNHYNTANPFVQSVVDHPQAPNTNNQLPAGDTHLLYPGTDGPWSSTRLEAHRIGFEDAELFRLLKKRNKKQTIQLIEEAFRSYNDYETSVKTYRQVRKKLLDLLDITNN